MYLIWINCALPPIQTHSDNVLKYSVTYKPVSSSRKKINVWAEAPRLCQTQLSPWDKPKGVSTYCKGKRTLDMLLFRMKLFDCLFSLFKYSAFLWILSPHCYIPSLGHVVIQAAWTQQAGVHFLTPLQTRFDQHNPQEQGQEAEGNVVAWVGEVGLSREQR